MNLQFFCCFQVNLLIALDTGWDIGMNLLVPSCDRISIKKMTIARGLGARKGARLKLTEQPRFKAEAWDKEMAYCLDSPIRTRVSKT